MSNGFYGSLSKIQKINFQFDRIFPNRTAMDQEAELGYYIAEGTGEKLPPVFNGRYVLVDYHEGDVIDKTVRIGYKLSDNSIVAAPGIPFDTEDGVSLEVNDIVTVIGEYDANEEYTAYNVPLMYRYQDNGVFDLIQYTANNNTSSTYTTYEKNRIIDGQQYTNIGRGWDSTVWQKTYQDGKSVYVMIAELNAFSPTIALAPEAPHLIPVSPYIGTDSTLDFYRIHMESPAGIRIKRAEMLESSVFTPRGTVANFIHSSDLQTYPSDVTGDYAVAGTVYSKQPLAIYYNKKGINKFVSASEAWRTVSSGAQAVIKDGDKSKDSINFTLTGRSGKFYSNEASTPEVDMYELSIMLPSIGESISKIYDLVYGGNRYYNSDGLHLYYKDPSIPTVEGGNVDYTSLYFTNETDGRGFRNTDTYWNSHQGIRAYKKDGTNESFDAAGLSTLAGTINSAHDLMGMIIRDYDNLSLSSEAVKDWDPTKIYFKNNKYYIKSKNYSWEAYQTNEIAENPYEPIYFLPTQLQDANDDLVELDDEKTYFLDIREGLYRESWEEYPTILDSEVYDTDKESLFGEQYINYIKVKDENDLIEGAVYGVIKELSDASSAITDFTPGHRYYYYDTSVRGLRAVYRKRTTENDSLKNKGIYYDLDSIQDLSALRENTLFYIPNVYYVRDNTTGVTTKATAGSLMELLGKTTYNENTDRDYSFFKKVNQGQGTSYVEDPTKFVLKYITVPETDRWTYTNEVLTIYTDNTKTDIIEEIPLDTYNGFGTIEFNDLDASIPVGYWTKQYTNTEKKNYYTLDEIFLMGLDPEEYDTPKYDIIIDTGSGATPILIPDNDTDSVITALKDFEEDTYFYFHDIEGVADSQVTLEDMTHLMQQSGQTRNNQHQYYKINWQNIKVMLQNAGGAYYKTAAGDYKLYPVLHAGDPLPPTLVGETRQELQPLFVPIADIDKLRVFKPNTYYTTNTGGVKAAALPQITTGCYYERTGNIVGNSEPYWPNGMEWNDSHLPENGTLGEVGFTWVAKEIKGMAEDFNTMHGLILKINQLLDEGNKYSRDSSTIRGILNKSQDVLTMLEAQGYSFSGVQVDELVNNILEADSPGAILKLVSNNSLLNLTIEDGKLKFKDTVLNGELNENNNSIAYLTIGNVAVRSNPQIITYQENVSNIEDYINPIENKNLAINARKTTIYGSQQELTGAINRTASSMSLSNQWIISSASLNIENPSVAHINLISQATQPNKFKAIEGNPYTISQGGFVYECYTHPTPFQLPITNMQFTLTTGSFSFDLRYVMPSGGTSSSINNPAHTLKILNNNNVIYTKENFMFDSNGQTSFGSDVNMSLLNDGTFAITIDDLPINSSTPTYPFINKLTYVDDSQHILKIYNNNQECVSSSFRFGNYQTRINLDEDLDELEDGTLRVQIDSTSIFVIQDFVVPSFVNILRKNAEFNASGNLKLYGTEAPTFNSDSLIVGNQAMRMVWEPEVTEGADAHPTRLMIYSGSTPLIKIQAESE